MEKSPTPACLGFCGRVKLMRHVGVGVVNASGEVDFLANVSFQPMLQCIEVRGQCALSRAADGRGEVGGNNCHQRVQDWEADLTDQGQGEAEKQEASCRRVFVEGRKDIESIGDCGGGMQEEGHVQKEKKVEVGVGAEEEAFGVQQPNTYEAERNKRVAKVQERLQLLLSAKSDMWVGLISGFLLFLGSGCSLFPFARTGSLACGQWGPAQSHPHVLLQTLNVNT